MSDPLRLPVVQARSGDGLDGRRRIGLNPAEGDVGTADAPSGSRPASPATQPDEGRDAALGEGVAAVIGEIEAPRQMGRPPLLTRANRFSIAVESRFDVAVRLPAIGWMASTAHSRTCAWSPRESCASSAS